MRGSWPKIRALTLILPGSWAHTSGQSRIYGFGLTMAVMGYRRVTGADGVELAIRESGPAGAPVLLCVHGYPDDGSLWDGLRALLDRDYRVVAYDVRGAGE